MPTRLTTEAHKQLDALVDAYPKDGLPGTVVALTNSAGEQLYLKASGPSNVTTKELMKPDTVSVPRAQN
jgi:hypothetical protein